MKQITVTSVTNFQNEVTYGESKTFFVDEPLSAGGDATGPDPYTLVLAGLGGCTSMTVMLYARRKGWDLRKVTVTLSSDRVHASDCSDCRTDSDAFIHRIDRRIEFEGELTTGQIARLGEIAAKCPVGKLLESEIRISDEISIQQVS